MSAKEPDILYRPSPWQQRFHSLTKLGVNEALGAGSAGPGKTTCLLYDACDQIAVEHERCAKKSHKHFLEWGESTGWALHLRRTRLQLEQTIRLSHRAFRAIDPDAVWNEQKSTWVFSSGFRYQFGHCKDPNDWESYMSFEFSAIYFDELTAFNEEQYDQIITRLRSSDPVLSKMLKVRSMSNPLMRREGTDNFVIHDPHWVRRRFVDPNPKGNQIFWKKIKLNDGTIVRHGWVYMPAKLDANPDKEFVRSYEANLRNAKPHIRAALLDGDWYVTVGSFFAEYWDRKLHTCKPFPVSPDWRIFRSMDWGFKKPGCLGWYALDDEDTLYKFKELRFQGKTDEEVAEMVKATEQFYGLWDDKRDESRITGVADTQLWEQRGDSGENKAEVFRKKGVPWLPADKKSRQTNAGHIIKRLTDHDDGTRIPGLVIFDNCTWILQILPAIQTSQTNSEEPADGGEDHPYDELAYACAYASKGKAAIPRVRELKSEWDDEEDVVNTKRRGRHGYGQDLC
jgi:phage terminase large subunit